MVGCLVECLQLVHFVSRLRGISDSRTNVATVIVGCVGAGTK
jgi:hypothetical protein